jgi:hypothetical protein
MGEPRSYRKRQERKERQRGERKEEIKRLSQRNGRKDSKGSHKETAEKGLERETMDKEGQR